MASRKKVNPTTAPEATDGSVSAAGPEGTAAEGATTTEGATAPDATTAPGATDAPVLAAEEAAEGPARADLAASEAATAKPKRARKKKGDVAAAEAPAEAAAGSPLSPEDPSREVPGIGEGSTGFAAEKQGEGATGASEQAAPMAELPGEAPAGEAAAAGEAPTAKPKRTRKKKGEAEAGSGEGAPAGAGEGAPVGAEGATAEGADGAAADGAGTAGAGEAAPAVAKAAKPAAKKKKGAVDPAALEIPALVEHVLSGDERVIYFGVKHFSPACAHHLTNLILELSPVGVLIEGPEDATSQIPFMVHEDTRTPFTVFSSYVDRDNQFGLNGTLSPGPTIPARYRSWWPFTEYAPEYAALKAAALVGAEARFIDAPLTATIPHHHVPKREATQLVDDRHLAENAYFEALRTRQRRRSFEEFWAANFEVGCQELTWQDFQRRVLTFAACARRSGGPEGGAALEADGTLLREALMRHHLDAFLKEKPEGKVVVVTGAFHSVALPFTKGVRPKIKNDKNLETVLTGHSFPALGNLYHLNRLPAYGQAVWEAMKARSPEPFNAAAIQLLIEVMRQARDYKEAVSTADSVGAYQVARNLAVLRQNAQITLDDIQDAILMTYVKGDQRLRGAEVARAAEQVLIGNRLGRVTAAAGQPPLLRDYYASCKQHKLDISGVRKEVRCDIGKQEEHRYKSAFLHQASFAEVPMFSDLESGGGGWNWRTQTAMPARQSGHYKGPNIATGEGLDLIAETWGVQWGVKVDDRLIELSDRGATLGQVCGSLLREQALKVKGQAKASTELLLRSVQMMLPDVFIELLGGVEDAIVEDALFHSLVQALNHFVALLSYRESIPPALQPRVLRSVLGLFNKACLMLPGVVHTKPEGLREALDDVQTLVRITLTFEAERLDRQLLTEKMAELVSDPDGSPAMRGAGYGVLFSFGATSERSVTRELNGYLLGTSERVLQAGAFLDGLFGSSKSIVMGSPRLLHAISEIIKQLDWATFKVLLPDLRRAFTQFIPTEIDRISEKVSEDVGLHQATPRDEPIPEALARVGGAADDKVASVLADWC